MKVRKFISAFIAAALALSLTACANNEKSGENRDNPHEEIPVAEADAFKYEYNAAMGGMVITDYLKESPKLHIPDTLENEPVVGVNLYDCEKQITELIMPDSVIRMSLSNKTKESLTYISMPSDGTDYNVAVKYDPDYYGKMTADQYYEKAVEYAHTDFYDYKNLTDIGISEKSPRYSARKGMLYYNHNGREILLVCPQGKSGAITVPNGTTEIGVCAFSDCAKLTSITVPDSVTAIDRYAFSGCTGLTSITIPDSVEKFDNSIFDGCENVNVTYKGKTYSYPHIGELFDLVMYGDTGMEGGMLIENNTLVKVSENAVTVEIPSTVTEIHEGVFNGCDKLTSIKFKNKTYTRDNLNNLYAAVRGEEGLTIKNGVLTKVSPELTEVVIPDRVTEVANDPNGQAFRDCDRVTKVTFGKGITKIEGNIYFGGDNSILVGCYNLKEVVIPEGVTSIDYIAFVNCEKLQRVVLSDTVDTIGYCSFANCTSLSDITIPNSVNKIGTGAFLNCTGLTNIIIPDSVTSIAAPCDYGPGIPIIGYGAFDGCEKIQASYKGKTYDYDHIDDLYKAING